MALAAPNPPRRTPPAWTWLRAHLFSGPLNAALTLLTLMGLGWVGLRLGNWALTQAQWAVIGANFRILMVGPYPAGQLWRVWTALILVSLLTGGQWGARSRGRSMSGAGGVPAWPFGVVGLVALVALFTQARAPSGVLIPASAVALFAGFFTVRVIRLPRHFLTVLWAVLFVLVPLLLSLDFGSGGVESRAVGGLLLTVLLAAVGMVASFPLGVLLALGRVSEAPIIRTVCTACIEAVRGTSLVVLLFVSQLFVPLLLGGVQVDPVLRALVGITVFSAAYLAENVRGGLLSVPRGQTEAALAVGLSGLQTIRLVVLPQALRAVLPVLAGQFIALFKDTSLVAIIGLSDLTGVAESVRANPEWTLRAPELLAFLGTVYFVFSAFISGGSRRLERKLDQEKEPGCARTS